MFLVMQPLFIHFLQIFPTGAYKQVYRITSAYMLSANHFIVTILSLDRHFIHGDRHCHQSSSLK